MDSWALWKSDRKLTPVLLLALSSPVFVANARAAAQVPAAQKPAKAAPAKSAAPPAVVIPPVPTAQPPIATSEKEAKEFRKGVLIGEVVDQTGKPVPNATVAVVKKNGKVLAWAKTDAQGEYRVAADPKTALHLRPSKTKGLLLRCAEAVGTVAEETAGAVLGTVVTPGATAKSAATSIAGGTSGSEVAQADTALPDSESISAGDQAAGAASTNAALSPQKGVLPAAEIRGSASIVISAPGFKDAVIADRAYWLDPPTEVEKHRVGIQAWMQTVKVAPSAGKDKCGAIPAVVDLSAATVTPDLAPAGSDVNLKVKLESPDPAIVPKIRVFARLSCKPIVVELTPSASEKGFYEGKLHLDANLPTGATTVCIGALRGEPVELKFKKSKPDVLLEYCRRVPDMQGGTPYGYDPFVMASVNRMDVKLTILPAK